MKFLFVFLLIVNIPFSEAATQIAQLLFQRDLYMQENECGNKTVSKIQALSFDFDIAQTDVAQNLNIIFKEKKSGFKQNIFYNQKTFYYPGVFGANGHHEYGLPDCEASTKECSMNFFVFLDEQVVKNKNWLVDMDIQQASGKKKTLFQLSNYKMDNKASLQDEHYLFNDLSLTHDKKSRTVKAVIDKAKIKKLVEEGYKIHFIFSWRTSKTQVQYSESAEVIAKGNKWLSAPGAEYTYVVPEKVTYLSFMVHAKKGFNSFESKLEIENANNSFYACKKR